MRDKIEISVEFFPPKNQEGAEQILRTAQRIKNLNLNYASITYGAGGSTRERTIEYTKALKEILPFEIMPHLTCVGHSKDEILEILQLYKDMGLKQIMALRGDAPKDISDFKPHPNGFKYASELVSFIKENFPEFKIYAACYPECHSEAKSLKEDVKMLKIKADSGVDCFITQLFFDNQAFYRFKDICEKENINQPITAGLLPALSLKQAENFCSMVKVNLPNELKMQLSNAKTEEETKLVGANWTLNQIEDLVKNGFTKSHLYILNRAASAINILEKLKKI